jgi:hypothetical protein
MWLRRAICRLQSPRYGLATDGADIPADDVLVDVQADAVADGGAGEEPHQCADQSASDTPRAFGDRTDAQRSIRLHPERALSHMARGQIRAEPTPPRR